jgi:hypothetical protein
MTSARETRARLDVLNLDGQLMSPPTKLVQPLARTHAEESTSRVWPIGDGWDGIPLSGFPRVRHSADLAETRPNALRRR